MTNESKRHKVVFKIYGVDLDTVKAMMYEAFNSVECSIDGLFIYDLDILEPAEKEVV